MFPQLAPQAFSYHEYETKEEFYRQELEAERRKHRREILRERKFRRDIRLAVMKSHNSSYVDDDVKLLGSIAHLSMEEKSDEAMEEASTSSSEERIQTPSDLPGLNESGDNSDDKNSQD